MPPVVRNPFLRFVLLALALLVAGQLPGIGDDGPGPLANPPLAAADQLYRAGKFLEAEAAYQAILQTNSRLMAAEIGLVRSKLRQQKVDEALQSVNAALAAQPNSAALLAAKGDVQFRLSEMAGAELSYFTAKKLDPREVHAYLGLAQLYRCYSLYRRAYDQLQLAREIAPDDIEVRRAWLSLMPPAQRLAALTAYLEGPHPDDEEETQWMTEYLDFLKASSGRPLHRCRLVSKVEQTETKLETIHGEDGHSQRGIGLSARLNNRDVRLILDTGAGGILVSRKVAEKAGLEPLSQAHYGGVGDKGLRTGYRAVANHIRIGELEFEDCTVTVSEQRSVAEEEGLIGADVFGSYLVDIDIPGMRLKLSPLPKRPEDQVAPKSLNSQGEEQTGAEPEDQSPSVPTLEGQKSTPQPSSPAERPPRDRYIAPEMAAWTKVFRFGHMILVPTNVNDSKPLLFLLDTGAFSNIISVRAGRQASKVSSEERLRVQGLSGEVNRVYTSAKVTLRFGHLRQPNLDIVTLDLSADSRRTGTEVSGFLGFSMLRLLEVKLDYRDGLVDFEYDPKRVPPLHR